MAYAPVITGAGVSFIVPRVRTITPSDLIEALARGIDDFLAMPTHAIFLCLIYPVIGLLLGALTFGDEVLPLLYPLISGFALIGPLAAIGLYELSRRRERGLEADWSHAFDVLQSPSRGAIAMLGLMLLVFFGAWIVTAETIYWFTFGDVEPASVSAFAQQVFTTPAGWTLIVVGNLVGFGFALAVLTLSLVAFPLLIDRPLGAADAVLTSIRVVRHNPSVIALWGIIVAALLLVGSLPAFLGLAVVLPVLGHATWHLYRKVVIPEDRLPLDRPRWRQGRRSAADFPVALFAASDDIIRTDDAK